MSANQMTPTQPIRNQIRKKFQEETLKKLLCKKCSMKFDNDSFYKIRKLANRYTYRSKILFCDNCHKCLKQSITPNLPYTEWIKFINSIPIIKFDRQYTKIFSQFFNIDDDQLNLLLDKLSILTAPLNWSISPYLRWFWPYLWKNIPIIKKIGFLAFQNSVWPLSL